MPVYFHRTTSDSAGHILREGFRDTTGSYMLEGLSLTGVFVSSEPLDVGDLPVSLDTLLTITLDRELDADLELVEDGKQYREWCVPAAVLNAGVIRRLTPAEENAVYSALYPDPFDVEPGS